MPKTDPILDALAAGTALNAVTDKDDPNRFSKVFFASAVTAYRSAKQNEEMKRQEWRERRGFERNRERDERGERQIMYNRAVEQENAALRAQLLRAENDKTEQEQNEKDRQKKLAVAREFIVGCETALMDAEADEPFSLANFWLAHKVIRNSADGSILGLEELRALATLEGQIKNAAQEHRIRAAREVVAVRGVLMSASDWCFLKDKEPIDVDLAAMVRETRRFRRRRLFAIRYGVIAEDQPVTGAAIVDAARPLLNSLREVYPLTSAFADQELAGDGIFEEDALEAIRNRATLAKSEQRETERQRREQRRKRRPIQPVVVVPDLGGFTDVQIIDVGVKAGDVVEQGDALVTLETEKASMDVPSELSGTIAEVCVDEGDYVNEGQPIVRFRTPGLSENNGDPDPAIADGGLARKNTSQADVTFMLAQAESSTPDPRGLRLVKKLDIAALALVFVGILSTAALPEKIGGTLALVGFLGLMVLTPVWLVWGIAHHLKNRH